MSLAKEFNYDFFVISYKKSDYFNISLKDAFFFDVASRGAAARGVTAKPTGCGFDPHSRR